MVGTNRMYISVRCLIAVGDVEEARGKEIHLGSH